MRISDWSSDVCSSDLREQRERRRRGAGGGTEGAQAPRLPRDPRRGGGAAAEGEGVDRGVEGGDWRPLSPSPSGEGLGWGLFEVALGRWPPPRSPEGEGFVPINPSDRPTFP